MNIHLFYCVFQEDLDRGEKKKQTSVEMDQNLCAKLVYGIAHILKNNRCCRAFHMLLATIFSQVLNISLNFNICEGLILRFGSPQDKVLARKAVTSADARSEHTAFCLSQL